MDATDLLYEAGLRAKHGPPVRLRTRIGDCANCPAYGMTFRWVGLWWCDECLPELGKALRDAPTPPPTQEGEPHA